MALVLLIYFEFFCYEGFILVAIRLGVEKKSTSIESIKFLASNSFAINSENFDPKSFCELGGSSSVSISIKRFS